MMIHWLLVLRELDAVLAVLAVVAKWTNKQTNNNSCPTRTTMKWWFKFVPSFRVVPGTDKLIHWWGAHTHKQKNELNWLQVSFQSTVLCSVCSNKKLLFSIITESYLLFPMKKMVEKVDFETVFFAVASFFLEQICLLENVLWDDWNFSVKIWTFPRHFSLKKKNFFRQSFRVKSNLFPSLEAEIPIGILVFSKLIRNVVAAKTNNFSVMKNTNFIGNKI